MTCDGQRNSGERVVPPPPRQLANWIRASGPSREDIAKSSQQWRAFVQDVESACLAGILLECPKRQALLPANIVEHLKRQAARSAFQNVHAQRQLGPVVAALNRAGIPVMLLKGVALLQTIYARPELRPMSDVDLLVRPQHARQAMEALLTVGCKRGAALLREDFFPRYHYEVEMFIPGPPPVRVDLHARPFRPMRLSRIIPDGALWENAVAVDFQNTTGFLPRPEFFLIHLAAHAAFHGCSRLLWLYDLQRFVKKFQTTLDWDLVVARCEQWSVTLAVRDALCTMEALIGPSVPSEVIRRLAICRGNWRDRLTLTQAPRDAQSPLRHVFTNLLCTPGVRFGLAYAWRCLFPDGTHFAPQSGYHEEGRLAGAQLRRLSNALMRCICRGAPFAWRRPFATGRSAG